MSICQVGVYPSLLWRQSFIIWRGMQLTVSWQFIFCYLWPHSLHFTSAMHSVSGIKQAVITKKIKIIINCHRPHFSTLVFICSFPEQSCFDFAVLLYYCCLKLQSMSLTFKLIITCRGGVWLPRGSRPHEGERGPRQVPTGRFQLHPTCISDE